MTGPVDLPFAPPLDIILNLPTPLSVNRTRKIDWRNYKKVTAWQRQADAAFLMQKRGLAPPILGRYEIILTLADGSQIDADNVAKQVIDIAKRFQLVQDDSPTYMRRVVIEFGDVEGCRVTIRAMA